MKQRAAYDELVRYGIFENNAVSSRCQYFWLEDRPKQEKAAAVYLADAITTIKGVFHESGVVYKVTYDQFENTTRLIASLSPVFDARSSILKHKFGPISANNNSIVFDQESKNVRIFFDTCTEALRFIEFIKSPKPTESVAGNKPAMIIKESEELLGYNENFIQRGFTEESCDSMIDLSLKNFFYLNMEQPDESMEAQLARWKKGLRWFNEVETRVKQESTDRITEYFQINFSNELTANLLNLWNTHMDKFNFEETASFLGIVTMMHNHTKIFQAVPLNDKRVSGIREGMAISLEALFMNNFASVIRAILSDFWSKNNFEFVNSKIVSKSVGDIIRTIGDIRDKMYAVDSLTTSNFIKRICANVSYMICESLVYLLESDVSLQMMFLVYDFFNQIIAGFESLVEDCKLADEQDFDDIISFKQTTLVAIYNKLNVFIKYSLSQFYQADDLTPLIKQLSDNLCLVNLVDADLTTHVWREASNKALFCYFFYFISIFGETFDKKFEKDGSNPRLDIFKTEIDRLGSFFNAFVTEDFAALSKKKIEAMCEYLGSLNDEKCFPPLRDLVLLKVITTKNVLVSMLRNIRPEQWK